MTTANDKNSATALHLSALTQYFIPFGNFIFPVIIWSAFKEKSAYINQQGKQALNFQMSLFLYSIILLVIAVPVFLVNLFRVIEFSEMHHNNEMFVQYFQPENLSTMIIVGIVAVLTFIFLKTFEFFLIIYAAVRTSNGSDFKYPLTINFIK